MAGLAIDETVEEQPKTPTKRKGFLSRQFSRALLSAGVGFGIGMVTRTCATALLCSAGAPAIATAITAMAASGLVLGLCHSYRGYRREKAIFSDTKFMSKQTLATTLTHTSLSLAGGWLAMSFGDIIGEKLAEGYSYVSNTLGFAPDLPTPDIMTESPVTPAAPEAITAQAPANFTTPQIDTAPDLNANNNTEAPTLEKTEPVITESTPQEIVENTPETNIVSSMSAFEGIIEIANLQSPTLDEITMLPPSIETTFAADTFNYQAAPVMLQDAASFPMDVPAEFGAPAEYTVSSGDNMWKVIETHYGLTSNADIQKYVDAIAVFNGMEGVNANHIDIGDTIMLPEFGFVEIAEELQLDWQALEADTHKRLLLG